VPAGTQPIVYISYRWLDVIDQGLPSRAPDPHARELADKLRANGLDVRFDLYYLESLYGFAPPQPVAGNRQDPWFTWSGEQIAEADAVLMYCTSEYASTDPDSGASSGAWWNWSQLDEEDQIATGAPGLWWDWLAMSREWPDHPQKFIPIGTGRYHRDQIPAFVRGATYLNLSDEGAFDALLRRIRQVWRERVPRSGVFISYAHKDDQSWLDNLLSHLSWLNGQHSVEFWTDRNIEPGDMWHEKIQAALDRAKVAVLLVSPEFLASSYITSNELPKMLQAAETDGMKIFWIPVRPSAYKHSPIAKFQAAHAPDKPLAVLRGAARDQAFVDIGERLAKVLGVTAT
jgi:TIR domain